MQRFLLLVALGMSIASHAAAPEPSIEALIARESPSSHSPGLAYAVVSEGEVVAVGARGVVRVGGDEELTAETPFVIGSISKSFTALAVMQLVEAGQIELERPLSHYLDGFSGRPAGAITILQLLSHTSGFSTPQGNASHADRTGEKDELARWVDALADVKPAYAPDERWDYSNANYQILGRLIEVVSGREYQAYVTSEILEPLGMRHSFVSDGNVHAGMAVGHTPWFGTKRPLSDNTTHRGTAPQGGIVASAGDLALYMQMMMNGEDDLLSADGKALMLRPAGAVPPSPFYGLGWFVDSDEGRVWHSGTSPGVETLMTLMPGERNGVVVLVNSGSGMGFGETAQLRSGITAQALGLEYDGERSRGSRKALFLSLALLPLFYLFCMIWAWRHRVAIRAKSGIAGRFSLWFPLIAMLATAWVFLGLVPQLFGAPLGTLVRFQPDLVLTLKASAVTGLLWALFRLGVAYSGEGV